MFGWFRSVLPAATESLDKMTHQFGEMLDAGRHMFDSSANALLGGTDLDVIREGFFATDKKINAGERQIRREVVVHGAVHGASNLGSCLTLMTVVKDAERIGDYAKNIFDVASATKSFKKDEYHADLVALKDRISTALAKTRTVFDNQDELAARELAHSLVDLEDHCDSQLEKLVGVQAEHPNPVTCALSYRYFKRVASHAMNIATSIFMPVDKIDYLNEPDRGRK